jgi:hypothetical protein
MFGMLGMFGMAPPGRRQRPQRGLGVRKDPTLRVATRPVTVDVALQPSTHAQQHRTDRNATRQSEKDTQKEELNWCY